MLYHSLKRKPVHYMSHRGYQVSDSIAFWNMESGFGNYQDIIRRAVQNYYIKAGGQCGNESLHKLGILV
jgi:hypothetical protein